jgi:Ca-activated chloride channel family protein
MKDLLSLRPYFQGERLRRLMTLLVLSVLPSLASPQQSTPLQKSQSDDYTLRVNVDQVVLHATAQNSKGVLVSGLDKDNFHVYEDGVLQQVKYFSHGDIPVTVGLVIDNSGSMKPRRSDVIAAALAFARSSNPQDQMFVVNFNEKVSFGLPSELPFTDQVVQLEFALDRSIADGETALYDAIAVALEHLKQGNRDKKVLIVISDGGDNASKHNLTQVRAMAGQPDAIIYTIGIFDDNDGDKNPGVLRRLAKDTGGEAFLPQSLEELLPICERIARDIRNQYTIVYVPSNRKRDGTYRNIQVKADAPGHGRMLVRTRAGYYAPLGQQLLPATQAAAH